MATETRCHSFVGPHVSLCLHDFQAKVRGIEESHELKLRNGTHKAYLRPATGRSGHRVDHVTNRSRGGALF